MSGIIFGNMLSGLGTGISGYAGQMSRDRAAEEEFRQRMELQRERERALQERATAAARPAAASGDAADCTFATAPPPRSSLSSHKLPKSAATSIAV